MKGPIIDIVTVLFNIYFYILIARVILTYMTTSVQMHPISLFIMKITDPILHRLRKVIPDQMIGSVRVNVALILLLLFYKLITQLIIQLLSAVLL